MQTEFLMGTYDSNDDFVKDNDFLFSFHNLLGILSLKDTNSISTRQDSIVNQWLYMKIEERANDDVLFTLHDAPANPTFSHSTSVILDDADAPDFLPLNINEKICFIGVDDTRTLLEPPSDPTKIFMTIQPNTLFRAKLDIITAGVETRIRIDY
jgi:hypothetical protein